jgi:predicted AlkP superfamily phosphohydrolase/phosphomutase
MGPYEDIEFRVNEFLREEGFVETAQGGMPAWLPILNDSLREGDGEIQRDPGLAGKAVATAAKLGMTPARAGTLLRTVRLDGVAASLVPAQAQRAGREGVDFATSTAYVRSWIELGVRINLAGREPEGIVPEEEYESVREELIQLLSDVRTPEGEPVFSEVVRREAYFDGPHVDDAVDVITVPRAFETMLSADLKGEVFGPPAEPWNHKMEGLLVANGEAIEPGEIDEAHLFDVAPTICSALSIPRSERMDGRALPFVRETDTEAYDVGERERRETDDEAVEGRLAALGYLEGSE